MRLSEPFVVDLILDMASPFQKSCSRAALVFSAPKRPASFDDRDYSRNPGDGEGRQGRKAVIVIFRPSQAALHLVSSGGNSFPRFKMAQALPLLRSRKRPARGLGRPVLGGRREPAVVQLLLRFDVAALQLEVLGAVALEGQLREVLHPARLLVLVEEKGVGRFLTVLALLDPQLRLVRQAGLLVEEDVDIGLSLARYLDADRVAVVDLQLAQRRQL